ncbi:GNAT superfamily N-acetyltransferase [Kitasatospora sp. GAS204A]|uniref:GNAT family N-acetyltransferase n=1 Tax=unclassified Kitasatospora TaxID=2633591 RepID=UPI002473B47E|nr:GNAT family N-acetyltransferase [Kitasatospora sp. GAS204B]MDH6121770.1 GNAT superfamily N-acetyltransferase [Kitasatospora sp. GAS204B]
MRPASPADAAELARIHAEMVGVDATGPWRDRLADHLREQLGSDRVAAFVIDDPAGGLAACAIGVVHQGLPGPDHAGVFGQLQTVVTEQPFRRRGYGRAVTCALVEWLTARGCTLLTLNASDSAVPLYASLGFASSSRAMRFVGKPYHRA